MNTQKKKNKFDCVWSVVCEGSSVDVDSNNISLFELVEELVFTLPKNFPKNKLKNGLEVMRVPVRLSLVSLLRREDATGDLNFDSKLLLVDPDGKITLEGTAPVVIKDGKKRLRMRSPLGQLVLTKSGSYKIRLQSKINKNDEFDTISELPLEIRIQNPEEIKK